MFQGLAYKFWADREFPILKELTDFSVSQHNQQDPVSKERNFPISGTCPNGVVVQEDKALHQNLNEVLKILPDKKTKLRSQKISQPNFDQATNPGTTMSGFDTPINRKRRNSLDSMRSLSAKKSATISELKLVVSNLEAQITEINSVLKSQAMEKALEDKFQQLQDKMTQLDKSSKVSY